mmetsp:Transcript_24200/g.35856  ORF Transcript_24200/g.35856 Transcript_24200/m.35856 type:complete len:88 (-) Transcript_24200:442-705(-)
MQPTQKANYSFLTPDSLHQQYIPYLLLPVKNIITSISTYSQHKFLPYQVLGPAPALTRTTPLSPFPKDSPKVPSLLQLFSTSDAIPV